MISFQMTPEMFIFLFFTGFCAGFVDSIAGGGGLIALPALLSVGLPAHLALGTNKLQSSFGSFSAAYNYIKKGEVKLEESSLGILFTLIGAMVGAWAIQQLDAVFIRHLIPILLAVVLSYTLFSPKLGYEDREPKMERKLFFLIFGIGLGFYDGFFGPGTGSFWTVGFLIGLGFNMTKAAGFTKVMNFTSNIVALCVFALGDKIIYSIGISMALGQIIGARMGSSLAIRKGAGFIRPVFMAVVFLTIARLVYVNYA